MSLKGINKIIVIILAIVLAIIFGTKCVYAATKKNDRIEGYTDLVNSNYTNHNVGGLIVLASDDDYKDTAMANRIRDLVGDYESLYDCTLNMGWEYAHTYCVQHTVGNVVSDMRVKNYIKIQGTQMVEHKWTKKENDNLWHVYNGSTYDGTENAILAYILANSNDTTNCEWSTWEKSAVQPNKENNTKDMGGPRQIALWKYWNTWLSTVSENGVLPINTWRYNKTIKETLRYYTQGIAGFNNANNNYSVGKEASISATETSVSGSNPALKVKYVGTITSVKVTDTNNNQIPANNIEFYSDAAYTNKITMANIPKNGTSFYIKNTSGKTIKQVEINVEKTDTYQVELWLLESTGYLGGENVVPAGQTSACQKLMTVKDSVVPTTDTTIITYNDQGTITINKTDEKDTNIKLNAGFKIHVGGAKFLGVDGNGNWVYDKNFSDANIFYTTNGTITINNLALNKTYEIWEVEAPNGYDLSIQSNYNEVNGYKYANHSNYTLDSSNLTKVFDTTNRTGSLTVTKKDLMNNSIITAVTKFKVGNTSIGWLKGTKGSYSFIASKADADLYETKDGVLYLDGLPAGNYIIEEVEAPSGYDLSIQTNTIVNLTINKENPNPSGELKNIKTISVKGYVWVDKQEGKQNDSNGLFETGESKIEGVKVRLMKKGTIPRQVASTSTNSEGEYIFNNLVKESEIDSYYIEFNYNGVKAKITDLEGKEIKEDVSKYIPVALNATNTNGSKAIMNNVAKKDVDLSGIATTYAGTNVKSVRNYGLRKVGTLKDSTLSNVNLGIKKIPTPDYNITQNLAYVKIDINGYTFTYNYGGQGDTSMIAAPKTNWQKKGTISGYTADIYPSDIAYSVAQTDDNKRIKVYVVYRIDIKNTMNYNISELYKESKLRISSLKNYYDGNRYTLEKLYNLDNSNNVTKDFDDWSDASDTKRNGKDVKVAEYNLDKYKDGIEQDKTITSFIEFRVKDDAIKKILENPNGIIEEYPTEAESTGYHEYTRKDYSWNLNITNNIQQPHITPNDIRDDAAPYLIFREHKEKERTIKGKVFEDKAPNTENTVNVEKLGDGLYNNNENVVQGIKVDLIDVPSGVTDLRELSAENIKNLQPATRYPKNASGNPQATKETITTDKEGNYNLVGVVPERYFLRFTYGDGTQKICDTNGNEIKAIVGKDYKSTIVKEENAKTALNGGTKEEWYKDMDDKVTASVALDNLNTRKVANEANEGKSDVMASTAKMSVTIENNDTTDFNMPKNTNYDTDEPEKITLADSKDTKEEIYMKYLNSIKAENEFDGLSFGIIEVPKLDAEIKKVITNVRLTNTQGNVLYNGNPETVASQGVVALSDLDNEENGGSTYVRAEMVEESLYGTNLELTYEVEITNKSDINYYNNEYYWFGNKNLNKEVTLTPTDVKDYLDESLTYVEEKSDKSRITSNGIKTITIEDGRTTVKAQEMELKGWKAIYTNKIENRPTNHPTSDKLKIVANRLLSNQDEDMEVVSRAEIKAVNRTPDTTDLDLPTKAEEVNEQIKIAPKEVHTNGMVKATFTITPPTGENRSNTTIYAIAGIMSLIILSTGIVIIKKKVI